MTNNNNNNNKSNQESTPLVVQHDRDVATGDLSMEGAVTLTTPTSISSGKRAVVGLVGGLVVLMMMVLTGNTPTTPSKIYWGSDDGLFASLVGKKKRSVTLTAVFYFEDLIATVRVRQSKKDEQDNEADWKVNIYHFNDDLCPSGALNWHVHEYPGYGIRAIDADPSTSAVACAADVTGGHYDPTFACGPASQNNANGVCPILRSTAQAPAGTGVVKTDDSYAACQPDNQSSCEVGDQSGKLGKLTTSSYRSQRFTDTWMTPIESTLSGRSLVLHCCYTKDDGTQSCGPRLACANLE